METKLKTACNECEHIIDNMRKNGSQNKCNISKELCAESNNEGYCHNFVLKKSCNNCRKKHDCKIINSCKEIGHDYCKFHSSIIEIDLKKEYVNKFTEAAKPLMKFLCENEHPHVTAIITQTTCELLEGKCSNSVLEFIID